VAGPQLEPPPDGGEVHPAIVAGSADVLGLLFAASWCTPCTQTVPLLAAAYKTLRARGKRFEIGL
jgi:thiol-disulfide isomerase/thioredoxin